MKKLLLLICFLVSSLIYSQTLKIFWDLNNDKQPDLTYDCSSGDTITAKLYLTNGTDTSITDTYPIFAFEIPVLYGYYTRWSSNSLYSNILTLDSAAFDSTALYDSTSTFTYAHNSSLKRFNLSFEDAADSVLTADSCLATFTFVVDGTGSQILYIYYLGEEDNYNMAYNTAVLNSKLINYSLWVRNCIITSK